MTWTGANLIFLGVVIQQFILALLLINHPSVPVGTVTKVPKFNELSKTLKQQGVLLQLLITGTVSGAAISGVFADINNIAFESGVSQERSATILVWCSVTESLARPCWAQLTKYLSPEACQIGYCVSGLTAAVILSFAWRYEIFVLGLIFHSIMAAGFSGLKTLIFIELVGMQNLPKVTLLEAFISGIVATIVPMTTGFLAEILGAPKFLFYINSCLLILCILASVKIRRLLIHKRLHSSVEAIVMKK